MSSRSLRGPLALLVMVPLSLSAVSVGGAVTEGRGQVSAAARAETAVRDLTALSAARTALVQEVMPTFSQVIVRDAALALASGFDEASAAQLAVVTRIQVGVAHRRTDSALATVPPGAAGDVASSVHGALAALRTAIEGTVPTADNGTGLAALYDGYERLNHVLQAREQVELATAMAGASDRTVLLALADLQLVSGAVQAGNAQLPFFLGTRVPLGVYQGDNRRNWLTYWGAYRFASQRVDGLTTAPVRQAWAESRQARPLQAFEAAADEAVGSGTDARELTVAQVIALQAQSASRDAALDRVLQVAGEQALERAAAGRQRAQQELETEVAVSAAAGLLALVLVALTGRWITRSLGRLAEDATHISQGALLDVVQSGPREVRTVARALEATVRALRRVEDQARAVARGELSQVVEQEPLPGPLGAAVHQSLVGIVDAIHEREELQSRLAHQAAHDQLTSLPNRAQALRLVTGALHRAQRSGTAVALLFVDLDHFKQVNDAHGHATGDAVLQVVSVRMERLVRSGDVVCRLGGDEFVVLVESVDDDTRMLLELADRIIRAVSQPVEAQGRTVQVGASIGIAVSRDAGTDADHLLAEADAAAYQAKADGRGRAELFDEALRAELADRSALEDAIRLGLDRGEFLLHYQPVIDVASGELCSFEALMRWERPGHGLVPPAAFIPVAEQSTLVNDLGRWAMQQATRQLVRWTAEGFLPALAAAGVDAGPGRLEIGPHVTMAVNLSGRHLGSPDVLDDVRSALADSGLPPHRLVLELTETTVVDDPTAVDRLAALRELGVSVAIDDFGTGYTSIGQLQYLPADTLKIDRSFIASDEPRYRELVRLIVSAAHTFGLRVVAEGVEEPYQLQALQELGCDEAQGFLIARPTAADDMPRSLPGPQAAVAGTARST